MTKSYAQLQKQIQDLQKQANHLKQAEIAGVVTRIKEAVKAYGLTAADLGLGGAVKAVGTKAAKKTRGKGSKSAKGKGPAVVKFRDETGNVWGGRGPRPKWLRDALTAGKGLQDFAV